MRTGRSTTYAALLKTWLRSLQLLLIQNRLPKGCARVRGGNFGD